MKNSDIFFYMFIIMTLFIILVFPSLVCIKSCVDDYNEYKKTYDISSATIIDTHVSYSRFGTPVYYFVYKFPNGSIKQKNVTADEYYKKN